jgi:small nuclear ribonucleoprotein
MPDAPVPQLDRAVDRRVSIRLKDQRELTARLRGFDEHLNLVLDETVETTQEQTRRLGRILLRGSNILVVRVEEPLAGGRPA